jgi:predicted DNA-binding transcriptional regulator AlpA
MFFKKSDEVRTLLGMGTKSGSGVHYRIARRRITKPVRLPGGRNGWPDYEIDALVRASIAGVRDEQFPHLVDELEAARPLLATMTEAGIHSFIVDLICRHSGTSVESAA